MRKEIDFLGEKELPDNVLYGIQSLRAEENFPCDIRFSIEWYMAMGMVKQAFFETYISFYNSVKEKYKQVPTGMPNVELFDYLISAAIEMSQAMHFEHFIVPAISGGAGTSINMNVNEILANRALQLSGEKVGDYSKIDPIQHANIYQSTNDTVPTALKVAATRMLQTLEESINQLRESIEKLENTYRNVLRVSYTQLQEAVPSSWGQFFSAWSDAFSRDWWRISKISERIRVVNAGGGAIGTGLAVPRYFIMNVTDHLRTISETAVSRSENMPDATSNWDSIAEAHAVLKSLAVNLEKFVSDIRLLASDAHGKHVLSIPPRQMGSSIMPGKVNPVIPEFVISVCHKIYSNDQSISALCGQGALELNAYGPSIGHYFLESIRMLNNALSTLKTNMTDGIEIDIHLSAEHLLFSPSISTALVPWCGYKNASKLASLMKNEHISIVEANNKLHTIEPDVLSELLKPANLLKQGYSLNDIPFNHE